VLSFGITDFLASSEEDERRYLMKADVIIAIQSREADLLRALVPERQVILAGVDFDVVDDAFNRNPIPSRITVVASDNPLNVHGLRGFLAECWPAIKQACPTATLHVVGLVGQMCHVEDPSILYSGWVADLAAVYQEASVVINPAMAGTGLKIKSVEALAHGKPLVAWTNGVDGLRYEGEAPFVECRSWQEYRDAIIRLLTSDSERIALSKRALAYARLEFEAESVYADLRNCLGASKQLQVDRAAVLSCEQVPQA
jgi:glycosyltransferase involved in cell wall biosynthesis